MHDWKQAARRLTLFTVALLIAACAVAPTSPLAAGKMSLNRDEGPVPCDSTTIIPNGQCVNGYIVPW
jgi:hypothetical protein